MKTQVGFIGLGAMGKPMALNLINRGYPLNVFDFRKEPLDEARAKGAVVCESGREVAGRAKFIITMLPSSPDVERAVLGPSGVLGGVQPGSVLIDMSTISPLTTRTVGAALLEKGVDMIDAPVTKGVSAAEKGTLSILVGGKKEVVERCRPLLECMGTDIVHTGDLGSGEVVKIVNNLILATIVNATSEALVLGVKAGVDPDILLQTLKVSSAGSYVMNSHIAEFTYRRRFDKERFPVTYMLKDLGLARELAESLGFPLFFGALSRQTYTTMFGKKLEDRYHPVVIKLWEELAGVEVREG
ncbi:MAG: NAD-binding protein [Deltaproteobacteria bacterium]|nr:NAD-binding protein [Deltaproteobacteria bacterium]MBW2308005.1 NAD-binding protein [Deltaproteobacteria bacterium]